MAKGGYRGGMPMMGGMNQMQMMKQAQKMQQDLLKMQQEKMCIRDRCSPGRRTVGISSGSFSSIRSSPSSATAERTLS